MDDGERRPAADPFRPEARGCLLRRDLGDPHADRRRLDGEAGRAQDVEVLLHRVGLGVRCDHMVEGPPTDVSGPVNREDADAARRTGRPRQERRPIPAAQIQCQVEPLPPETPQESCLLRQVVAQPASAPSRPRQRQNRIHIRTQGNEFLRPRRHQIRHVAPGRDRLEGARDRSAQQGVADVAELDDQRALRRIVTRTHGHWPHRLAAGEM
ncbi:MAG: hypothetical protein A2Z31_04635 [candidate division NC10 bacterium RBG_16_65_8]|nr:MAG: hypothetical protein A2Z31_04635 [candidate division NC10 bacterium RBG_16_65_8]